MVDVKVFKIDVTVSEYNKNDEGFYTIKSNLEIAKGPKQLTESLESIYFNITKYIKKRIK